MLARSTFASRSSGRYVVWSASIIRSSRSAGSASSRMRSFGRRTARRRARGRSGCCQADRSERYMSPTDVALMSVPSFWIALPDTRRAQPGTRPSTGRRSQPPAAHAEAAATAADVRDPIDARQHARAVDVAVVAAEQLVAAVAAERHGDVLPRQLRHEEGRQLRRIGERLVEDVRQARDQRARPRRRRAAAPCGRCRGAAATRAACGASSKSSSSNPIV